MLQTGFLRRVLEALERVTAGRASLLLNQRLRGDALRLFRSPTLAPPTLAPGPASRRLSVDDAESFLFAIDDAVGDGSGSVLEAIGQELGNRYFLTCGDLREDVLTCMRRAGAELTAPFTDTRVEFRVSQVAEGLEIFVSVPGQPKATRALRHLSAGYLRAAFTFAFEATSIKLRILGESVGDRASIAARYRAGDLAEPLTPVPPSARSATTPPPSSRTGRSGQIRAPSIAEEVDRIMKHAPRDGRSGQWRRPKLG